MLSGPFCIDNDVHLTLSHHSTWLLAEVRSTSGQIRSNFEMNTFAFNVTGYHVSLLHVSNSEFSQHSKLESVFFYNPSNSQKLQVIAWRHNVTTSKHLQRHVTPPKGPNSGKSWLLLKCNRTNSANSGICSITFRQKSDFTRIRALWLAFNTHIST